MSVLRTIGRRLWDTARGFSLHEGMQSAAAVAYYVALSFFPLLLVLVAGLTWILRWTNFGQAAKVELLTAIQHQVSPELAKQVGEILQTVGERAGTGGPIGFVILVVSCLIIFAQIDYALDRIFQTSTVSGNGILYWVWRMVSRRLKALIMLVGLGGFIFLVMIATTVLAAVLQFVALKPEFAAWADWATGISLNVILNLLAFTLIYRVVPKPVIRWREALQGGMVAAVLWEIGRQGLSVYLMHTNYQDAYGIIGSFLVVMLWTYYGSMVLLFGAEYVRATREE